MRVLLVLVLVTIASCKDPFIPNLKFKKTNFLAVEGYINVGTDVVTTIRLSRTVPVNTTFTEPLLETKASIFIEDNEDNIFPLTETEPGVYISGILTLPVNKEYRLRINTQEGKVYYSDFLLPIVTPAIDSVNWTIQPLTGPIDGIDIYVSTHDPQNNTHYYQWEYDEVWERRSPLRSVYKYENGGLVQREDEEIIKMRTCWQRAKELDLITENTIRFSRDAISRKLVSIPVNTERLGRKYSIRVRQHALSVDAYNYLEIMKINSNSLGTFFDPQPSQLYGNIRHENSSEPVIGFMGAYTTSSKLLYIYHDEIPWWDYDLFCNQTEVGTDSESLAEHFGDRIFVPLTLNEQRTIVYSSHIRCVDCRFWGGNNNRPDYWE